MKRLFAIAIALISSTVATTAQAHSYDEIAGFWWSADGSWAALYTIGSDCSGAGKPHELTLFDTQSGARKRRYLQVTSGRPWRIKLAVQRLTSRYKLLPGTSLAPDPKTFSEIPWPGWPTTTAGRYVHEFSLAGKRGTLILRVYPKVGKPDVVGAYKLFVRSGSNKPVLVKRFGPLSKDDDGEVTAVLAGLSLSPDKGRVAVMVRIFVQGYEGADAAPVPIFLSTAKLLLALR